MIATHRAAGPEKKTAHKKRPLPNRLLQQAGNSRFSFYPAHSIADFARNGKPPV